MKLALLVVGLLSCATAAAGERSADDVRRLYLAGRQAFEEGRLEVAEASFEGAYRIEPRPAFLWNLGQTYRRQFKNRKAEDVPGAAQGE